MIQRNGPVRTVGLIGAMVICVAGCGASAPNSSATVASCQWSKPVGSSGVGSLSYCFTLSRSVIRTGQTASATLAIRNSSDHTIAFSDGPPGHGCAIDVEAALQGSNVTITPNFPEDCELPPPMLTTGITKVPLSIATAYNSRTMTDQPTQNMPRCDGNGVTPALPAGDYTVSLMTSTGDPFAQVESDPLKLTN